MILIGRLCISVTPTIYFFKVPLVGRFMPLVGGIGRLVESPLNQYEPSFQWNTDLSITHLSAHSDTSQDKIKSR